MNSDISSSSVEKGPNAAAGFEPVALYQDDDGKVAHAEMRWGSDPITFGTARDALLGHSVLLAAQGR